jgi:hypothetical protein
MRSGLYWAALAALDANIDAIPENIATNQTMPHFSKAP